ncbi:MAG: hypothetical protein AAF557_25920 [Pseudomonadota bacterium]
MFKKIMMLGAALMLSACAIGNKYEYNKVTPQLGLSSDKAVTVAVSEQRPYVLSGNKGPDFVGLQRAGFGNPWPVHTSSGAPLATELGQSIAQSLKNDGISAQALAVDLRTKPDQVSHDADRLLFVTMKEWKTDIFTNVTLHWNMQADVADQSGAILATNSITGVQSVEAAAIGEDANSAIAVSNASKKLKDLLGTPEIQQAIQ